MLDLDYPPVEEDEIDGGVDVAPIAAGSAAAEDVNANTAEFITPPWITVTGQR